MTTITPNLFIQYVSDTARSVRFYSALLGTKPVDEAPTFAMFALSSGLMLGLWKRDGVQPVPVSFSGGEWAAAQPDDATVDAAHGFCLKQSFTIAQPPMDAEYGRNFLVLDPDENRIRVFCPKM